MSFFGFDPTKPPQSKSRDTYDFQDTYEGIDEPDALNDQTFGNVQESWKDSVPPPAVPKPTVSYAQAATGSVNNDDDFMEELWGADKPSSSATNSEKKVLSLEEIEAQLTAIDQSQQQVAQQPQPQFGGYQQPPLPPHQQQQQFMYPPQGYMPPPGYPMFQQFPGQQQGQYFPQQYPGQFMQFPGQPQPGQFPIVPPPQQQMPVNQSLPVDQAASGPLQGQMSQPQVVQPQVSQPQVDAQGLPAVINGAPNVGTMVSGETNATAQNLSGVSNIEDAGVPRSERKLSRVDPNQFPVLGSKYDGSSPKPSPADLTPEEQSKYARRHQKVARIMKYSGIMNPRDKDFVTRFQLSQIVTEDPYNEDFYAQVFKVIHPKTTSSHFQDHEAQNNSIAQAYLDHSGHRLGGRYNKADLALQRMQQQVQRAVTVAKERPKLTEYAREGALGRISLVSGKKPRQQLEIFSEAAKREIEKQEQLEAKDGNVKKEEIKKRHSSISAPVASASGPKKQYTRKDVMRILENIITKLMILESDSGVNQSINNAELWESLKILEQPSTSGANPEEVNPFIQCLNHKKALKILSRLFKFLSREQILTIVTLVMSNLENLNVIKQGSYTTYENKKVPANILSLVECYSLTFSKVLMNAVQDFKFNEIIGLLVILIEHNNVSFVSTTKIGLSILTTLLSRAELIKGEGAISATDLSEWSSCYDELFTALESRIASIFPPHPEDIDDGSSRENYIWQFLATLSLGGKLSHQRIIVDEVRDEIFGVMSRAKAIDNSDVGVVYKKHNLLNNLNMYLVVMGLVADENEIRELQS